MMLYSLAIVIVIMIVCVCNAHDNKYKKDDSQYIIGINNNVLSVDNDHSMMVMNDGRQFTCTLPLKDKKQDDQQQQQQQPLDHKESKSHVVEKSMKELLRDHMFGVCVLKIEGYWTYEVCPFKSVRQFHAQNEQVHTSFNLGEWKESSDFEGQSYVQLFAGGDDKRSTQVTYICDDLKTEVNHPPRIPELLVDPNQRKLGRKKLRALKRSGKRAPYITSVVEKQTHVYQIEVRSHTVCPKSFVSPVENSLAAALSPLYEKCLYHVTGWWTYEFCYLRTIRQFHKENKVVSSEVKDGKAVVKTKGVITDTFDLGFFKLQSGEHYHDGDESKPSRAHVESVTKLRQRASVDETFAKQTYSGGSLCDLTKKPRKVNVHFYCSEDDTHRITSITETATCEYTLIVATPSLCRHKSFMPKKPNVSQIVCHPTKDITAKSA